MVLVVLVLSAVVVLGAMLASAGSAQAGLINLPVPLPTIPCPDGTALVGGVCKQIG
jgi:hypothetical protein